MEKILLVANTKSRSGSSWQRCQEQLGDREDIVVHSIHDQNLDEVVQKAVTEGCATIVAAGGDGTVSAVANAILRSEAPLRLGVLPTGTLNHFAKDLSIPMDLTEALRVIDAGHTKLVDAVRMNDRYFINNSSLGVYPALVKERERLQKTGLSKWFSLAVAAIKLWTRPFFITIDLGTTSNLNTKKVASVFIGNNRYRTEGTQAGKRSRLDEGILFIALLRSAERIALLRLAVRAIKGRAYADRNLDVVGLTSCTIDSDRELLHVAYDGEVAELKPPITYTVVPKALRVIVPAG